MQVAVEAIHIGEHEAVRRALIHFELAARYQPRCLSPGRLKGRGHVLVSVNDQRRRGDLGQFGPEVGLSVRAVAVDQGFQRSLQAHPYSPLNHLRRGLRREEGPRVVGQPLRKVSAPPCAQSLEDALVNAVRIAFGLQEEGQRRADKRDAGDARLELKGG